MKIYEFETFEDFCNNADDILRWFKSYVSKSKDNLKVYKKYIYENHIFSKKEKKDMLAKDKCWTWLMSYQYEMMDKNDLYCTLGTLKKEKE